MKQIIIFFKSNSNPLTMIASTNDVEKIFNNIIQTRKDEKINTLLIEGHGGKSFIDPHEVVSCEITSKPPSWK